MQNRLSLFASCARRSHTRSPEVCRNRTQLAMCRSRAQRHCHCSPAACLSWSAGSLVPSLSGRCPLALCGCLCVVSMFWCCCCVLVKRVQSLRVHGRFVASSDDSPAPSTTQTQQQHKAKQLNATTKQRSSKQTWNSVSHSDHTATNNIAATRTQSIHSDLASCHDESLDLNFTGTCLLTHRRVFGCRRRCCCCCCWVSLCAVLLQPPSMFIWELRKRMS